MWDFGGETCQRSLGSSRNRIILKWIIMKDNTKTVLKK